MTVGDCQVKIEGLIVQSLSPRCQSILRSRPKKILTLARFREESDIITRMLEIERRERVSIQT